MNSTDAEVSKNDGGVEGKKFAVANLYKVKLSTGSEFSGIVLAYDVDSNIVIFEDGTKPRTGNLKDIRAVNANFIVKSEFLGNVKDTLSAKRHLVDLIALQEKEKLAISEIEGKSIFKALSKTISVVWENSDILVMGEVRISCPYTSDCVTGGSISVNTQVKRILKMERKKLQLSLT